MYTKTSERRSKEADSTTLHLLTAFLVQHFQRFHLFYHSTINLLYPRGFWNNLSLYWLQEFVLKQATTLERNSDYREKVCKLSNGPFLDGKETELILFFSHFSGEDTYFH